MSEKPISQCLRYLLYPVVKFCLRHSLKLQDLLELAKLSFLEVAEEELYRQGREVSSSRLSIMTGVHRKDVVRLKHDQAPPKKGPDLITRLIGQWQSDRRFSSKRKGPKVLSYESMESDFAALVASVSREVNPYTVLFELERVGLVKRTRTGLKLKSPVYFPKGSVKEGFRLLGSDVDDLLSAVEENVLAKPKVPNLHIKTEYDNVPASIVPRIRQWFLDKGSVLQEEARKYLSQCDRDINPELPAKGGRVRVALGTFSRVETLPVSNVGTVGEGE
jgi:hypothetical protein